MTDPELLLRLRRALTTFRQARADRIAQENQAAAERTAEQKQANDSLAHIRREAEAELARDQAVTTQRFQADHQFADTTLTTIKQEADKQLRQTESAIAARYTSERRAADTELAKARQEAEAFPEQIEVIGVRYNAECQAVDGTLEIACQQAKQQKEVVDESLDKVRFGLRSAGLANLLPITITPVAPEDNDESGLTSRLDSSKQAVIEAAQLAQQTTRDFQNWREAWKLWTKRAITLTVAAVVVGFLWLGLQNVQQSNVNATTTAQGRTTDTARAQTILAVTVQKQATTTAATQANATGTECVNRFETTCDGIY